MGLLTSLLKDKKKHDLMWNEVARENSENLAKAVKVYWETIGLKVRIKQRKDGRWSVFVLNTITRAKDFGGRPKPFTFFV